MYLIYGIFFAQENLMGDMRMKSQIDVINVNERPAEKHVVTESWNEIEKKEQRRIREKKRRMRRRARRLQMIRLIVSATLMVVVLMIGAHFIKKGTVATGTMGSHAGTPAGTASSENTENSENTQSTELTQEKLTPVTLKYEVGTPQVLEGEAITARLSELAEKYPEFEEICNNASAYPENLLAALGNNPEMIDFVKGYLTASSVTAGALTEEEKEEKHPHFLQWDPRWGYTTYGDDILALSGCGPTSLSMVVVALTDNKNASPDVVAAYAMQNDFYMAGTGTMWKLMTEGAEHFGLTATELEIDQAAMKKCIDEGGMMIATMAPGDFTAVGHFIVIYGYDSEGFFVNDPNCLARSQKKWDFATLSAQMKKVWGYQ